MPVPIYVVDAFTARPFAGSPAGVCILDQATEVSWMQKVAAEMRHSETVFISPRVDGFDLRWFTPTVEVDLCGHATLASAHILWETGRLLEDEPAVFHTKSGVLTCTRHGYGIQMDFPAEPATRGATFDHPALLRALGVKNSSSISANRMDILVEVADERALRSLKPDFEALADFETRGVIVTAPSASADYDFVSRFFAPSAGVPEDPITGSAHCCLGPYWAEKLGKSDLVGFQCSERGGTVRVAVRGDRVLLIGQAVTTLIGELVV